MITTENDADIVAIMDLCKRIRCTAHIRGSDARPVVELKDKSTRRVVGWSEAKEREAAYFKQHGLEE